MTAKSAIPFFTDNDVEDAVGILLGSSGHEVIRLRDVMLADSPDPVVDAACRAGSLVLVTHNHKHFRRIQREKAKRDATDVVSRIYLEIHQSDACDRLSAALPLIEAEWLRRGGVGLQIEVTKTMVRVVQN